MVNELEYYERLAGFLDEVLIQRNIETEEHLGYVQGYTAILADEYGKRYPNSKMTRKKRKMIVQASRFHDIGKIVIPDAVLNKVGRLSKSEMEILMIHTEKGSEMAGRLFDFMEEEFIRICQNICCYHHEKYDGSGYPAGIRHDQIPIEAQIVGLADMYDILMHTEIRGEVFSKEKVYYMLMSGACGELPPAMKTCLQSAKECLEAFCME